LKASIIEEIIELNFKSSENTNIVISVYDQFGTMRQELFSGILPKGTTTKTFDISNLLSNVYFIKISTIYNTGVFKIIKL
jgi:hypothetical protein